MYERNKIENQTKNRVFFSNKRNPVVCVLCVLDSSGKSVNRVMGDKIIGVGIWRVGASSPLPPLNQRVARQYCLTHGNGASLGAPDQDWLSFKLTTTPRNGQGCVYEGLGPPRGWGGAFPSFAHSPFRFHIFPNLSFFFSSFLNYISNVLTTYLPSIAKYPIF